MAVVNKYFSKNSNNDFVENLRSKKNIWFEIFVYLINILSKIIMSKYL